MCLFGIYPAELTPKFDLCPAPHIFKAFLDFNLFSYAKTGSVQSDESAVLSVWADLTIAWHTAAIQLSSDWVYNKSKSWPTISTIGCTITVHPTADSSD